MSDPILRESRDDVVMLTLNAPATRNAISLEMRIMLLDLLHEAVAAPACRAIVLTGMGAHFCSGGQVPGANGTAPPPDADRTRRNIRVLQDIVRLLTAGPKPAIAAVEGYAYGAGFSLAAACDIVVAGETAKFCASFGRIGLMADAGLIWSLPQRVGAARAREIMMSGRVVAAAEASAIGLINAVVPPGTAAAQALSVAAGFAGIGPLAIASTKAILARGPASLEAVLEAESDAQPELTLSQDYAEGRAAFKERRAPVFRGI